MACLAAIVNIDGAPVEEAALRALMDVTPYRPADASVWTDGCVGLGLAPLVADSANADRSQPRGLHDRLWAVMDGRLDDRGALVAALGGRPGTPVLARASDVELILHAYDAWGADCVGRLVGDFAFCVWDRGRRRLFCARDHFGVKPFYYATVGNALVVCSALKGLRRHPAISNRLHDHAIGDFLLFGLCMEASHTAFADVSRLPPGHRLNCPVPSGGPRVERYWSLEPGEIVRRADEREPVERFSSLMQIAVSDRLRADRVGVLMSGGLDSSSVASVAAEILGPEPDGLHAFTVVYDAQARDQERRYSSIVARSLGIGITHLAADDYEPFVRWDRDALPPEPSLEALTAVMADLLDLASAHGGAVLTGEGGDPLLLPSTVIGRVGREPVSTTVGDLWRACRARTCPPLGLRSLVGQWLRRSDGVPGWLASELLDVFEPRTRWRKVWADRTAARGERSSALNDMVDPWWASTFESLDPGATGRPVEMRYPFFDVRLVSYALTLPSLPWCLNKQILRASMCGRLPEAVLARPKTPLQADPIGPRGRWSPQHARRLFEATPAIARYVDVGKFQSMVDHDSLLTNQSPGTWAAISLAVWMRCATGAPGAWGLS